MISFSRGFRGRRQDPALAGRIPPGQYLTQDFPVLSAGPTPRTPLDRWDLQFLAMSIRRRRWTWEEFLALCPRDFHRRYPLRHQMVEARHRMGRAFRSIPCSDGDRDTAPSYLIAHCDGGYTTNLPLEDVTGRQSLDRVSTTMTSRSPRAWRPGPPPRAAPLLLEERQVDSGARAQR